MQKRILVISNDIGGGLGHVRRSIRLADILHNSGMIIGFVCHKKRTLNFLKHYENIFYIPFHMDKLLTVALAKIKPIHPYTETPLKHSPFYLEFNSYNYQVLRDGYFTDIISNFRFKKLKKVIDKFKPDLIIGDGHLLSFFLSRYASIPVFQTTRFAIFPENPDLIWWKKAPDDLIPPKAVKAFDPILDQLSIAPEDDAGAFLRGDAYFIPGNKDIEPIDSGTPHLFYGYHVDQIISDTQNHLIRKDRKNIFVTIGGGSGRSNLKKFYDFILDSFTDAGYNVIISDPLKIIVSSTSHISPDIKIVNWVESSALFPSLDLVVHHGGYSTTMESIWWGVPSLIIPSHTEQEGNGRRLEKLGNGKTLLLTNPDSYDIIKYRSYYGEFTVRAGFKFDLNKDQFIDAIHDLIMDTNYKHNAVRISQNLKKQYSEKNIIDFVLNFN